MKKLWLTKSVMDNLADNDETKELVEITSEVERVIVEGKDILAQMEPVIEEIGILKAFDFVKKMLTASSLKILKDIKESRSYKGLTYKDEEGKLFTVNSWDEFCQHKLSMSRQNIDKKLLNLIVFGEDFFEASQRIGLGDRELRKLRQLPEESRLLVIKSEEVDLGDPEAVRDLIDDLNTTYKKEISEAEAQLKANREMSNETAIKLQEANEALAVKKFNTPTWEDETKDFFAALHKTQNKINESLGELLALNEQLHFTEMDERAKDAASSAFFADTKLLVERFALTWNEIYRTLGVLEETAKPSGEWLTEMGFDGLGDPE